MINVEKIDYMKKEQLKYKQSANVLFNFMPKMEFLKMILENSAIIPRYVEEKIDYLKLPIHSIAFPMVCFCDIPLKRLVPHMKLYGSYGIGLEKIWGENLGVQPIQYVNEHSHIMQAFSTLFSRAFEKEESTHEEYNDYLLTQLLYMKPLQGKMFKNNEDKICKFHDEREWRFIPNLSECNTTLPLLIPQEEMNPIARDTYSLGMQSCEQAWLKFDYSDIRYIIVSNIQEREELINFIENRLKNPRIDKLILVSKILIYDELREDW